MLGKVFFRDEGDSLTIGYEDYSVGAFGGSDCALTYVLDKENRAKLVEALAAEGYEGEYREMMKECFGLSLEKKSFVDFCSEHRIEYKQHVWIS